MADEAKTEVQIIAETSKLKSGSAEAVAINKATTNVIKTDWRTAGAEIATSVAAMGTEIKGTLAGIGSGITSVQNIFFGLTSVLAGGAIFGEVINKTTKWAFEVKDLSEALGITTERASVLKIALNHIGVSSEEYAGAAVKVARTLLNNEKAFGDVQVSVRNLDLTYRNSADIMSDLINALGNLKEGTDRNVAAAEIFKRTHLDFDKLMRVNAEAMEEARKKAEDLHLIVGPEGMAKARQYKESMNDLKLVGDSLGMGIGSVVLPALTRLGSLFLAMPAAVRGFYKENEKLIESGLTVAAVFVAAEIAVKGWGAATVVVSSVVTGFTVLLKNLQFAIWILTGGFQAMTAAEMVACGGWIIVALAGIVAAFRGFGQTINDVVDIFLILKNAAEKTFLYIKAGLVGAGGDLDTMMEIIREAKALDLYAGVGQDWFGKAKGLFSMPSIKPQIDFEGLGDFGGKSDSSGSASSYEVAKANWQSETDVLGMSVAKKLELYKQNLANVEKTAKEELDYKNGLSRLEMESKKEQLDKELAFLELSAAQHTRRSEEGMNERIAIAKKEAELQKGIYGEDSTQYAQAMTKVANLRNHAATEAIKNDQRLLAMRVQMAENEVDIEAEGIRLKRELGLISEADEIAGLNKVETQKREIRKKGIEDELAAMEARGLAYTDDYKRLQESYRRCSSKPPRTAISLRSPSRSLGPI